MSRPRVPAELQDHIVDLLHDKKDALESCCLVSKSWVSRTRKHLFADITFRTPENVRSWKTTFSNPSVSPARYARSLLVRCPRAVIAADAEEGGWISTFSYVERFAVDIDGQDDYKRLVAFHGFSPAIKSLQLVTFFVPPPPHIFNLILSFPLLEDLSVTAWDHDLVVVDDDLDGKLAKIQSSSLPVLTGSLELSMSCEMHHIVPRLFSLSNGLRFRKLDVSWVHDDDILSTGELVGMCSSTLESLSINNSFEEELLSGPVDLSRATKLKDATFIFIVDPGWITSTLRTITCDHGNFQRLTIDATDVLATFRNANLIDLVDILGETTYEEWLELDDLLARLWESHSTCLEVQYNSVKGLEMEEDRAVSWMTCLLPEVMRKGRAKLVTQE